MDGATQAYNDARQHRIQMNDGPMKCTDAPPSTFSITTMDQAKFGVKVDPKAKVAWDSMRKYQEENAAAKRLALSIEKNSNYGLNFYNKQIQAQKADLAKSIADHAMKYHSEELKIKGQTVQDLKGINGEIA